MKNKTTSLTLPAVGLTALLLVCPVIAQPENPMPRDPTSPGLEPGLTIESSASVSTTVDYGASADISALHAATFENREETITAVQDNVAESAESIAQIKEEASATGSAVAYEVTEALQAAESAKTEVETQLRKLSAVSESEFDSARAAAIEALRSYAQATASLNAAVNAS